MSKNVFVCFSDSNKQRKTLKTVVSQSKHNKYWTHHNDILLDKAMWAWVEFSQS